MTQLNTSPISSDKNPSVKLAKALLAQSRQRKKHGQTVLEGSHLLDALIASQLPVQQVLVAQSTLAHPEVTVLLQRLSAQQPTVRPLVLTDKLYQSIRTLGSGIDIMCVMDVPTPSLPTLTSDCLILNDVQDSGNVGTLLRTAAAVGIGHVICTAGTAQAWSPKTLRSGMGAQFSLAIHEDVTIDEIAQKVQVPLLATSSHTDTLIYQQNLNTPCAWVMGHEGQGVSEDLMQLATPIALPQPNGQESLNVAIAGALCMYEMLRQRNYTNPKK